MRLVLTAAALTALIGALAWSTTGVRHRLTQGMAEHTAAWWGTWAVEPVISTVPLVVVGARAFLPEKITIGINAVHHSRRQRPESINTR